jgi:hypothetical protein
MAEKKKAKKERKPLTEKQKMLKSLKDYMRRALVERGKYSGEYTYQVEIAAMSVILTRKVWDIAMDAEEKPVLTEKSREGDIRAKENPIFTLYIKLAAQARRDLRALQMNKEIEKGDANSAGDDDALTQLMQSMTEEG